MDALGNLLLKHVQFNRLVFFKNKCLNHGLAIRFQGQHCPNACTTSSIGIIYESLLTNIIYFIANHYCREAFLL